MTNTFFTVVTMMMMIEAHEHMNSAQRAFIWMELIRHDGDERQQKHKPISTSSSC